MDTSDYLCRVYIKVSIYSLFWEGTTNVAGKEPIKALLNL
jgi:hypothetical protein